VAGTDWRAWHADYADPASALSQRLAVVQARIAEWLDRTQPRPVVVTSVCAGDGRDLLDVLTGRPDAARVTATLVELDADLAAAAGSAAADLPGVSVRCADAGSTDAYAGCAPADLLLLCGVLGNVADADAASTIASLPGLCAPEATVVWTRHRREPDLTPAIRGWFTAAQFAEESFTAPDDRIWSVGVHRLTGTPRPLGERRRLFSFVR
jgi:hypothetical protein